ncbi:MAG TPA: bifunctional riboflavin kinase/FAD synthetase [Flavipsychrobacter sp.]|nr:bifunctional riboflavin kinase/FAD synthetase [Flavipsychrobacter sp.]
MAVFFDIENLPRFHNAVLTIGTFDGVHLGHEAILHEVVEHAKEVGGESVLITFEPHPRKLLFPDQPLAIITPLDKKIELITEAGIQHVVVAPFTKEFSNLSAQDYIENFLVKLFHPHTIIIGYDHHFGHDRKGNIDLLKKYASQYQYEILEISAQLIDEATVSSTKIRRALTEGHVKEASHMLGRFYSFAGTVIHGNKLGRTIGYPTANIHPDNAEQLIPGRGIYAVRVNWNSEQYKGMLSIGYNPTVTDVKLLRIEVNIFDFDEDIYGQIIEIEFVSYLRAEEKFESIDVLKDQLHNDKEMALKALLAV